MKKACGKPSADKREGDSCKTRNRSLLNRALAAGLALLQCFTLSGCIIVSGRSDLPMAPKVTVPAISVASDVMGLSTKKYDIGGTEAFYILPGMESHPEKMTDFACFDYTSNGELFYMYTTPCYISETEVFAYKGTSGKLDDDFSGSPQPDRSKPILCDAMVVMRYNPVSHEYFVVDTQAYERKEGNKSFSDELFEANGGYYMLSGAYGGKVADTETYFVIDREGAINVYDKDGNVTITGALGALIQHELANEIYKLFSKKENGEDPDPDGDMSDDDKSDRDDLLNDLEETVSESSEDYQNKKNEMDKPLDFGVSWYAKFKGVSVLLRSAVMDGQGICYLSFMIYDSETPWDAEATVYDKVVCCYTAKLDESVPLVSYNRNWAKQSEEWMSYNGKIIDLSKTVTVVPFNQPGNWFSGTQYTDDGIIVRSSSVYRSNYKAYFRDESGNISMQTIPLNTPVPMLYPEQLSLLMTIDSIKGGLFDPDRRSASRTDLFNAVILAQMTGHQVTGLERYIKEIDAALTSYQLFAGYMKSVDKKDETPPLNIYSDDYSAFMSKSENLTGFVGGWTDVTNVTAANLPDIPRGLFPSFEEWAQRTKRLSKENKDYQLDLDFFMHPYTSSTELLDYVTAYRDTGYVLSDGEYSLYNNLQGGFSQFLKAYALANSYYGSMGWRSTAIRNMFGRTKGLWSSVALYDSGTSYENSFDYYAQDVLTDVDLYAFSADINDPELSEYTSDQMPEMFKRLWNGKNVNAVFEHGTHWLYSFWNKYTESSAIKGSTNNWKRAHYVGAGGYYGRLLELYLTNKKAPMTDKVLELEEYGLVPVMGGWNVFTHRNETPFSNTDRVEMLTFCNEVSDGNGYNSKVSGICEIPMEANGLSVEPTGKAETEVYAWNDRLERTYKVKVESLDSSVYYYKKYHGAGEGEKGKRFYDTFMQAKADVREKKRQERQDALDEIERRVKEAGDAAYDAYIEKNKDVIKRLSPRSITVKRIYEAAEKERKKAQDDERVIAEAEIPVPPVFTEELEKEYWDDKDNYALFVDSYIRPDTYYTADDIAEILDLAEHLLKMVEVIPEGTIPIAYRLKLPEGSTVSYADMFGLDGTSTNSMTSGTVLFNSKTIKVKKNITLQERVKRAKDILKNKDKKKQSTEEQEEEKIVADITCLNQDTVVFFDTGIDGEAIDAGSLFYSGDDGSKEMIVLVTDSGVKFYSGPEGGKGQQRTGKYLSNNKDKTWFMPNEQLLSSTGFSPQMQNQTTAAVEQRIGDLDDNADGQGSENKNSLKDGALDANEEVNNTAAMEDVDEYLHASVVGTLQSASSFTMTGMNEMLISAYDSGLALFNTKARSTVALAEGSYYQSFADKNKKGVYKVLGFNTVDYEYSTLDLARAKVYNLDLSEDGRNKAYEQALETQLGQMVVDYVRMPLRTVVNSEGVIEKITMTDEEKTAYKQMDDLFSPNSETYSTELEKLCKSVGMTKASDEAIAQLDEYREMVRDQSQAMTEIADLSGRFLYTRDIDRPDPKKDAYWLNVDMRTTEVEDRDALYDILVEIMLNEDIVRMYPNSRSENGESMRERYMRYRKIYDPASDQGSADNLLKENSTMTVTYENGEPEDKLPSGDPYASTDEENLKKADESANESVKIKIGDYESTENEREKAMESGDVYEYLRERVEGPSEPKKDDEQPQKRDVSEKIKTAGYRQEIINDIEKKFDDLREVGRTNRNGQLNGSKGKLEFEGSFDEYIAELVNRVNPDNFGKSREAVLKEFLRFISIFDGNSEEDASITEERAKRVGDKIPDVNSVLKLETLIISEMVLLGRYKNAKESIGIDEDGKYVFEKDEELYEKEMKERSDRSSVNDDNEEINEDDENNRVNYDARTVSSHIEISYASYYDAWSKYDFRTKEGSSAAIRDSKMYEQIIPEFQGNPAIVEFLKEKNMTWKEYLIYVIRNCGAGAVQDDSGDNENRPHDTDAILDYYNEYGTFDGISVDLSGDESVISVEDEKGKSSVIDKGESNSDGVGSESDDNSPMVATTQSGAGETGNSETGGNKNVATELLTDDTGQ